MYITYSYKPNERSANAIKDVMNAVRTLWGLSEWVFGKIKVIYFPVLITFPLRSVNIDNVVGSALA